MKELKRNGARNSSGVRKIRRSRRGPKRADEEIAKKWMERQLLPAQMLAQYIKFMLSWTDDEDPQSIQTSGFFLKEASKLVTRVKDLDVNKCFRDPKANDARSVIRRVSHVLNEDGRFSELDGPAFTTFGTFFTGMTKEQNGRKIWQEFLSNWPQFTAGLERAFLTVAIEEFKNDRIFEVYLHKIVSCLAVASQKLEDLELLGMMSRDEVRQFFRSNARAFIPHTRTLCWSLRRAFNAFIETAELLGLTTSQRALGESLAEVSALEQVRPNLLNPEELAAMNLQISALLDRTRAALTKVELGLRPAPPVVEIVQKSVPSKLKLQLKNLDLNEMNPQQSTLPTVRSLLGSNSLGFRLTPMFQLGHPSPNDRMHMIEKRFE